jgi:hypothetical protein
VNCAWALEETRFVVNFKQIVIPYLAFKSRTFMGRLKQKHWLTVIGIAMGVVYGVVLRLMLDEDLATITFMFVMPAGLGAISLAFEEKPEFLAYRGIILIPWITVLSLFLVLYISGREDLMCLFVLAAPFLLLGTLIAFIVQLIHIGNLRKKGRLLGIAFLPFICAPLEEMITSPSAIYPVASEIVIEASPAKVWAQVVNVPLISAKEFESGWFHWMGVPRPISATVDSAAVGGMRIGTFEGGLRFQERITAYVPAQFMALKTAVDPTSLRDSPFDQHVLGGKYFRFVQTAYTLKPLSEGKVALRLYTEYQMQSKINFYGKFWGDMILRDFQERLLSVIAARSLR